jgi:hypothetical protein
MLLKTPSESSAQDERMGFDIIEISVHAEALEALLTFFQQPVSLGK